MPVVDGLPASERRRHIPPRDTTTGPPEHPVEHRAVIGPPATATRDLVGQQRFQTSPFRIGQIVSMQHPPGLPHPALKIRGTRSSGGAAVPPGACCRAAVGVGCRRGSRWPCLRRRDGLRLRDSRRLVSVVVFAAAVVVPSQLRLQLGDCGVERGVKVGPVGFGAHGAALVMINKNCETRGCLWVPETLRTLCDVLILVDQSAQPVGFVNRRRGAERKGP